MKTKAFGKQAFMVKVYYRNGNGELAQFTETFYNIKNAEISYYKKCAKFGDDNVFIYKARQIMFVK